MNNTPKISLSIYRQGSALIRQSEVEEIPWIITKEDKLPKIQDLSDKEKRIIVERGTALHCNKVSAKVLQLVTLTQDAYDYFTKGPCPPWANSKVWDKLGRGARINAHCQVIAEEVGSTEYTFTILED